MKVPLSWLKRYVDIDCSPEELKEKLFSCGFEVETMNEVGADVSGVVVGEVTECEPIEGTHLHVCKVDCGGEPLQICCGADNVAVGIKAPVALVGATVYATGTDHTTVEGVTTIKKGRLRGIDSFGMLCSGIEIGVNGDMFDGGGYNGLLILPSEWENGSDVKHLLGLDDIIYEVAITANRPDCQSIYGLAREVAAILDKPIRPLETDYEETAPGKGVEVSVSAPDVCPRYIAHSVTDIRIAPSPLWMRRFLTLCGLRPINNVVDITNYVLLELGQPMHSFDLSRLSGRRIDVRRARPGEEIVTLDEKKFRLGPENLVICDGERPCALAGIMGGLESEITGGTTDVLFEAAKFTRENVRKTSRSLGQRSDSSAAFEKGVNEYTVELAMKRALHLICELGCGAVTTEHIDIKTKNSRTAEKRMSVSADKINRLLGIEIPVQEMEDMLRRLSLGVEVDGDEMNLTVPRWREDIDGYPDIAEEVIREYGYNHIEPAFMPTAHVTNGGFSPDQRTENRVKDVLVQQGLSEILTYSFYSEHDLDMLRFPADAPERKFIKIINPLGEELSVMRTTLAPSMISTTVRNLRRGNLSGRLFEISKVYEPKSLPLDDFPEERKKLCICEFGDEYDFFTLKGVAEHLAESLNERFDYKPADVCFLHPGISAEISCDGARIGYIGELDPAICEDISSDRNIFIAELDYETVISHSHPFRYRPLPRYPDVQRDIALVCDEGITCGEIEKTISSACKYVTDVRMFDMYTGSQIEKGKKSLAFTVTLSNDDEPITPEKADEYVKKILRCLEREHGIALR